MMKYIYWLVISGLIIWEMSQLKSIFDFSAVWQYGLSITLVGYFAYLLELDFKYIKNKIRRVGHIKSNVDEHA